MSYDRMTNDDPTIRREEVVYRDPDTGTRTIIYVVAVLIALGLVYLAATAFWGTSDTSTTAPVTIEQNAPAVLPSEPDMMAPAPEAVAPAPDTFDAAPVPAPAPEAGSLDAAPAPSAPPVTEPVTP